MSLLDQILHKTHSGACGQTWIDDPGGEELVSFNPADGSALGRVRMASGDNYELVLRAATATFERWRMLPAPRRGEIVREIGNELRLAKDELGTLVTLEMGKILAEGKGEVQEMIDVADFATGLSRQLHGLTMHSERPGHRMYEQWHPLGVVGVISAFNFPVAVWSWNALIAMACGDTVVWKPSSKTPLTAIAVQHICNRVLARHGWQGVLNLVIGSGEVVGDRLVRDPRVPLISATGSTAMGKRIAPIIAAGMRRSLLELGGNNGVIVMDDADPDLVVRAVLFGAVGTAGQRCTSIRRLFLQKGIARRITDRLSVAYRQIRIGDPSDPATLMGPLIDRDAVAAMERGLERARNEGGHIVYGGKSLAGCFVEPVLIHARPDMPVVREELFAPVLYLLEFDTLDEVLAWHNDVPQGLSSAIFTSNVQSAEMFLSAGGSDCGIANVNTGTSGPEIGGAFGGEKETGGGRESGSDSWKAYMRRQTVTVNWSGELPLAQGIKFEL
ncbi:MAG: aldehyde dehydrogenase family protein [Bryobacterales bacterium]|nr:aldehyde dehydrogenase family protein [Bryobacterales bacterium]